MSITAGPSYWLASVKPRFGKNSITKAEQDTAYALIEKLGIAGKRCKHRYLGDMHFKTEKETREFWEPLMAKHPILDRALEITTGFDLFF